MECFSVAGLSAVIWSAQEQDLLESNLATDLLPTDFYFTRVRARPSYLLAASVRLRHVLSLLEIVGLSL